MARAVSLQPVREWDLRVERITRPLTMGIVAGVLGLCLFVFGPPGGDAATHLYQTQLVSRGGLQFWDNLWYSGRYSLVNYTLLYYPLAVAVGQALWSPPRLAWPRAHSRAWSVPRGHPSPPRRWSLPHWCFRSR